MRPGPSQCQYHGGQVVGLRTIYTTYQDPLSETKHCHQGCLHVCAPTCACDTTVIQNRSLKKQVLLLCKTYDRENNNYTNYPYASHQIRKLCFG